MKQTKYFNKLAGSALLLAGAAVGFTACSSDEEFSGTPTTPTAGETVKTQFAISVPYAKQSHKRLGSGIVQADETTFRGIKNLSLIPHTAVVTDEATFTLGRRIIPGQGELDGSGLDKVQGSAVLYNDVDVPVTTAAFLVYAEAKTTSEDKVANGALTISYDATPITGTTKASDLKFSLNNIYEAATDPAQFTDLLTVLNGVDDAFGTPAGAQMTALHTSFIAMKAGSSNSILAMLNDLYDELASITGDEATAAAAVMTKIKEYMTVSGAADVNGHYTMSWTNTDLADFPGSIGLPDGAVQVKHETGTHFTYVTNVEYGDEDASGLNAPALASYVYPPSLFYTTNTTIKVADESKADAYGSATDWTALLNNYTTTGAVTATTRSIALENQLQYAVGRFDVNPQFVGTIYDRPDAGGNKNVVIIGAQSFKLTGILIGAQKQDAAWDFNPVTTSADKTIYDRSFENYYVTGSAPAAPAYSLALETIELTDAGEGKVPFALELQNLTGTTFNGKDGKVPANGKFYLVGMLDKGSIKTGTTSVATSVFAQDYKTIAGVKITSLANAYNVIPDLRASKLELGLSVDLEWKEGIEFDVTID